jgi:hypothetical protein
MSSKQIIICECCLKIFKKKNFYENHLHRCRLKHNLKDNKPEITTDKLLDLIIDLTDKYNTCAKELENVKQKVYVQRRKIDIIEWLNTNFNPKISFEEGIRNIEIDEIMMDIIYNKKYVDGVVNVIEHYLKTKECFKCFHEKKYKIYVFTKDKEWNIITDEKLFELLFKFNQKIMNYHYNYLKINSEKLSCPKFQDDYQYKTTIILGGKNETIEQRIRKVKNKLYNNTREEFDSMYFSLE